MSNSTPPVFDYNLWAERPVPSAPAQAAVASAPAAAPAAAPAPADDFGSLFAAGFALSAIGALNTAISAYYAADAQRYQLKSQELDAKFQQTISAINAKQAEHDANAILRAGQQQVGRMTRDAGALKGSIRSSLAARGLLAGVGNAAEIEASVDISKEIDAITMNVESVRAANNARTQAQNYRTQGVMAGVSAANLRATRRTINPGVAAAGGLLSSSGYLARQWASDRRAAAYYSGNS